MFRFVFVVNVTCRTQILKEIDSFRNFSLPSLNSLSNFLITFFSLLLLNSIIDSLQTWISKRAREHEGGAQVVETQVLFTKFRVDSKKKARVNFFLPSFVLFITRRYHRLV